MLCVLRFCVLYISNETRLIVHDFISLFLKLLIKILITDIKDYKNILKVRGIIHRICLLLYYYLYRKSFKIMK